MYELAQRVVKVNLYFRKLDVLQGTADEISKATGNKVRYLP